MESGHGRSVQRRRGTALCAVALQRQDAGILLHAQQFALAAKTFFSFVNGQYTSDGGTHLSAFPRRLAQGCETSICNGKFEGDDVRGGDGRAVAIRLKDPMFESQNEEQTRQHGIRTELVNNVRRGTAAFFPAQQTDRETIMAKVKDTQELRKELQNVKKLARENAPRRSRYASRN